MITKFDKSAKAQYFKNEFAECVEDCDYEGALDNLIKYAEAKDYPDFHLACGMLYLQMTQDSDDIELYAMAFREFLMHIRRFPDCERAYRNILAVLFLRGSYSQAIAACRWIRRRGIDLEKIVNELAESGILFISPSAPADIDGLFDFGEYGEIDPCPMDDDDTSFADTDYRYTRALTDKEYERERNERFAEMGETEMATALGFEDYLNGKTDKNPTKIMKFSASDTAFENKNVRSGLIKFKPEKPHNAALANFRFVLERIEEKLEDGEFDENDVIELDKSAVGDTVLEELHKRLLQEFVFKTEDDYNDKYYGGDDDGAPCIFEDFSHDFMNDEIDVGDIHKMTGEERPSKAIDVALCYYENNNTEKLYEVLNGIRYSDPDIYKAIVLRAVIALDDRDYSSAERLLKDALSLDGSNPLALLLLTEVYESTDQTSKIPALLKRMNTSDFASVRHVYRVARLASAYCKRTDAMGIISELIDEYNILSLRVVYAQMLYNSGKKQEATELMYPMTRIYYNDVNADFIYGFMRDGGSKLKLTETPEAPTEVLSAIYDDLISAAIGGGLSRTTECSELFASIVKSFTELSFEQPNKLLSDMFETVRILTANPSTSEIMRDALVDPFAEQIVKFVILSTILEYDRDASFVLEVNYSPLSDDAAPKLDRTIGKGYVTAYAFMLVYCRKALAEFVVTAAELAAIEPVKEWDDRDAACYLIKSAAKKYKVKPDDRLWRIIGYPDKSSANKRYKYLGSVLDGYKGDKK